MSIQRVSGTVGPTESAVDELDGAWRTFGQGAGRRSGQGGHVAVRRLRCLHHVVHRLVFLLLELLVQTCMHTVSKHVKIVLHVRSK